MIGLPLRLLAREVYGRVAARVGTEAVALITGEEKIIPPIRASASARSRRCRPQPDASVLAIDEIQLAGDLERGHVFTDRILHLRGRDETLLLGAGTMRGIVEKLLPGVNVITRPRMSMLTYAGSKKITRLPRRSAIVAFSADEVYAVAELIRRQRGGAAVVLGSLSPRTRNAQVELFQNGDVEFLVATDAIGMGLNLDVDHVAFAQERKFDGYRSTGVSPPPNSARSPVAPAATPATARSASPARSIRSTTISSRRSKTTSFSRCARCNGAIARSISARSPRSAPASTARPASKASSRRRPPSTSPCSSVSAATPTSPASPTARERVQLFWDICQIPDYRRIAPANHAELVGEIFRFVARDGAIPDDWFGRQVAFADRTDGDIDTLANRIAHIRHAGPSRPIVRTGFVILAIGRSARAR